VNLSVAQRSWRQLSTKGEFGMSPRRVSLLFKTGLRPIGVVALLMIANGAAGQSRIQVWDPPAIKVFPDHDQVARAPHLVPSMVRDGEILFRTKFNSVDGAGRPAATGDSKPTPRAKHPEDTYQRISGPDANSCFGCHNQPKLGGSGDFAANVFVGAHFKDPPSLSIQSRFTNERNTTALFGSGAIEMLAREMTRDLQAQREAARRQAVLTQSDVAVRLMTKGVSFGTITVRRDGTYDDTHLDGIDHDLVVKPFGVKGIAVSLREFSIAALNQHHGIQAIERFGWERTGRHDFDEDGVPFEFSVGQVTALVLFQASLPALRRSSTDIPAESATRKYGERLFREVGCTSCHVPFLKLNSPNFSEPNPYNRPGTANPSDLKAEIVMPLPSGDVASGIQKHPDGSLSVWAYSDLKRHKICDARDPFFCNERLRQDNVPTDEFLTAKLWDAATSAPYGHRGDCDTLSAAIVHHAGEARPIRNRFMALSDEDKRSLIGFLLSVGADEK
jgi:cytochrome c peroxidase